MSDRSKIPYCDATWNVTGGCTHHGPGCKYCWSERLVSTRFKGNSRYDGLTKDGKWTGKIRLYEDKLEQPLHWRRPRTIFVCSMSDLFHEQMPFDFIDEIFAMTFAAPQHKYLFSTKRIKRAIEYFNSLNRQASLTLLTQNYLGLSISTQKEADEQIPDFLKIPGHRWLSAEPLLEDIDIPKEAFQMFDFGKYPSGRTCYAQYPQAPKLDGIVVGAESINGRPGRECKLECIESIVDQGDAAGVPVYVKQVHIAGKLIRDIEQFPKNLQIQELIW